jgi:hypothetical protein
MRLVCTLAVSLLLFPACNSDDNGSDMAVALDMGLGDDLAGADLVATDMGGIGAPCTTACDCTPGLGCLNNQCAQGTTDVYCCNGADCPPGAACQGSDQSFGTCMASADAGGNPTDMGRAPRDAGANFCPTVPCMANDLTTCMAFGCTMCVGGAVGMRCAR